MTLRKAKFIKTKKKIKANVFDLHFDEVKWVNGNKTIRDLIVHNGITCIVPIIDKKFIVLLKQYRYGSDQIMLEVPAGTIDPGEKPLSCAKRELIEETGIKDIIIDKNWSKRTEYFFHRKGIQIPKQVFWYIAETDELSVSLSNEHTNYLWLDFDSASNQLTFNQEKKLLLSARRYLESQGKNF